ncbi:OprO/OprP family phosphate-selective porin [Tannerella sp.]|uniref:OprO/OprP family phosphate-selective porin n=1 Tax=Tannerella sp. TaxID=2382127 RepID=UPI0026DBC4C4|nr:porin [Tannerella sp.]MDO4702892.1 porin [Tannerella sp.]
MIKKITLILCSLALCWTGYSQDEEEKLTAKPTGRVLMDAGLFNADRYNDQFNDGVAIPDIRIGVEAEYGRWKTKVDVGFAYAKVSLKDVYIDYVFNKENMLRGGYFLHHFGLQSATGSSLKISKEEPAANQAFYNSRLVGLMFIHSKKEFYGTLSLFAENEAIKQTTDQLGNEGYGMMSRLVYRPLREPGRMLHVGFSGAFESPRYSAKAEDNHRSYALRAYFPTRIARVKAQQADITDARMLYKFTPEVMASIGPLAIEAQYYFATVNREKGMPDYRASGAYAFLRGLIKGRNYSYSDDESSIKTPSPGSMELVLGYNYTDLSDHKANILGGRVNDWSFTFNYYLNKYMIWRVRGSLTQATDRAGYDNTNLSLIETRFQVRF